MYIRLYFLLPDELLTKQVVDDLSNNGVQHQQIHALKRNRNNTQENSSNPQWQRLNMAQQVEKFAWNSNLAIFFIAVAGLAWSIFAASLTFAAISVTIMLATFILGNLFAARIPRVHLKEFEDALSHGEILLMVDVPAKQQALIEDIVLGHHPAAIAGGSSWTIHSLGI